MRYSYKIVNYKIENMLLNVLINFFFLNLSKKIKLVHLEQSVKKVSEEKELIQM